MAENFHAIMRERDEAITQLQQRHSQT